MAVRAGFSVKKKLFFRNFFTLVVFGVGGTIWTGACLAVGSYYAMGAGEICRKCMLISISPSCTYIPSSWTLPGTIMHTDKSACTHVCSMLPYLKGHQLCVSSAACCVFHVCSGHVPT